MSDVNDGIVDRNEASMNNDRKFDAYRSYDDVNNKDDYDNFKKVDGDDDDDGDNNFNYDNDLGENHRVMCVREIKFNNLSSSSISNELTKLICRDCFCYADEVGDNDSDLDADVSSTMIAWSDTSSHSLVIKI